LLGAALAAGCAAARTTSAPVTFQSENLASKSAASGGIKGGLFTGDVPLMDAGGDRTEQYRLYYALNIGDGSSAARYAVANFSLRGVVVRECGGAVAGMLVLKPVTGSIAASGGAVSLAGLSGVDGNAPSGGIAGGGAVSIGFSHLAVERPAGGKAVVAAEVAVSSHRGSEPVRLEFPLPTE